MSRIDAHGARRPVAFIEMRVPLFAACIVIALGVGVVLGGAWRTFACDKVHLSATDVAAIQALYEALPDVVENGRAVSRGLERAGAR